ncbi:DUF6292 family protein [Amycolatopsis sp. FDAARGOS 1241]|uniref:DUF6292 family protein n=1 Tax=Amycolatopsis sp. FDAARGOS 1241 TaxID=2778070 RepID=UPI0019528249|nr:DUF6292 family protein [Amycolatopsis sp. FDAARGOS 1241]QRP50066.1 hypothetical protein I6J71_21505 [Amycolatopsis sp. FDAARGOS 1241]
MTASIDIPTGHHPAAPALTAYLRAVTAELGIGLESCTLDHASPLSAYLALDERHPAYPDRDFALLWDEERGWAAAVETHSGEDLIVVRYLGGTVAPAPEDVARFVEAVLADDHTRGTPGPVRLRAAGVADELVALLGGRTR